jgi:hypothetical protein
MKYRQGLTAAALAVVLALAVFIGFVGPANAESETLTFVCQTATGTQTFMLSKPNPNSATFTNGTTILVSAIGASITGGTAQANAVQCTVNGEGPFPFLIIRS